MITSIDLELGITAGVYFRVDDEEYNLRDHKDLAQELRSRGFEVGLHTACYAYDDYMKRFAFETEKFSAEAGFKPKSFTLHGLGSHKKMQRIFFQKKIVNTLSDYGYVYSDCHKNLRSYRYVIEDCHLNSDSGERFIYNDFLEPQYFVNYPGVYLVLTHPCYWTNN